MSGTRRKPGWMGPHIAGFEARLTELGYRPGTVRNELKVAGQLGRWMASEGVEVPQLCVEVIERFRLARRRDGVQRPA